MSRLERIEAEHGQALRRSSEKFGDHEGMTVGRVLGWLAQFENDDLDLGLRVLENTRYLAADNIRSMARSLRRIVAQELDGTPLNRVAFVAVGASGGGASTIARVLRGFRGEDSTRVLSMVDLAGVPAADLDAVVFVDDLSVTGDTLTEWWMKIESIVLPLGVDALVGTLVMTTRAEERIREFAHPLTAELIGPEAGVLSDDSDVFTEEEKARLLHYCELTGCGNRYIRGYGEAGLLLAFKHGCPNNSLPILWHDADGWIGLFTRRAI